MTILKTARGDGIKKLPAGMTIKKYGMTIQKKPGMLSPAPFDLMKYFTFELGIDLFQHQLSPIKFK